MRPWFLCARGSRGQRLRASHQWRAITAVSILAAAAACQGEIGGDDPASPDTALPGSSAQSVPGAPVPCKPDGPAALSRLSSRQYDNTVADLLGDTSHPAKLFASGSGGQFDTDVKGMSVSPALMEQFLTTAEDLSVAATTDEKLPHLLGCDPSGAAEATCIRKFIVDFGLRAYRRPLLAEEVDRLLATYNEGRTGTDVPTGVQWVLQRILVSPDFLYRVEVGNPAPASAERKLTPYEVASRLSYFLRGTMPDEQLLVAAANNKLSSHDDILAQVRRLMRDAGGTPSLGADATIKTFFSQWLGLQNLGTLVKDQTAFPEFNAQLVAAMGEETTRSTADIFWTGGGLVTALTGRSSFVDGRLATLYGIPNVQGDEFQKVSLPEQRSGLLTQASFLAMYATAGQTSPTRRGAFIRSRLLCQPPAPPPPNVNTNPPAVDANSTTRGRIAAHASDPFCASCHHLLDPVGFGLENFDALGRWRTTENGLPLDTTGKLDETDIPGAFKDANELSAKLAQSAQVRGCLTTQWFQYAYGREPGAADRCTIAAVARDFAAKDSFEELVVSLATNEAFLSGWAVEEAQ